MAEFGSTENILWFWAVLFFTVPPVLRFRENFMVPMLATLMVFGFYTQSYWMPDFNATGDWPRILMTCAVILIFYFINGFFIHFLWFRGKSQRLRKYGAFSPLLKAWIMGKAYIVTDDFIAEIRRLRMFEIAWADITVVKNQDGKLIISDDVEREPEILSEISLPVDVMQYAELNDKLKKMGKI
ncbi:MAG: hypothetical protein JKY84_02645 [Emcibacteraceae bacterium]|nr:hypothetical protein [Emcibacteraceae bacterium]